MFDGLIRVFTSNSLTGVVAKGIAAAAIMVLVSEIAKRSVWAAAALVALPLATILTVAIIALDQVKGGPDLANAFAARTFLLFWPGLVFFLALLGLQRLGAGFWLAFGAAVPACLAATWAFATLCTAMGWIKES